MQRHHFIALYFLLCFFGFIPANSQNITPFTMNNGGGSGGNMEWSIGESASVSFFNTNNLVLTTGVLQPLSNIVTGITDFRLSDFGHQILIGPNPTVNILNFKAYFTQIGHLSIQLLDAKSKRVFVKQIGPVLNHLQIAIPMQDFVSGLYYVKVDFKLVSGITQTGMYKIIKL